MTDATPCAGGPSNTRHAALARVCGLCEHYSATATEQRPGFAGSTCASFVPVRHADKVGAATSTPPVGGVG